MLKQSRVRVSLVFAVIAVVLFGNSVAFAQDLGAGPYERLIIRGGTVIDGTGAPPIGSTDIVIEGNRIVEVRGWMSPPGSPDPATRVIDATGMYVLPGFVDLHGHIRDQPAGLPPEYIYKTWLVHGITTVRDAASHRGVTSSLEQRELSARNAIVAPRIYVYVRTDGAYTSQQPEFTGAPITTPETARAYVRWAAEQGVDGFKSYGFDPLVFGALVDEANNLGLGTAVHLGQMEVARLNAVDAARLGVTTIEHFYGLGEALLEGNVVPNYVSGYDYNDEVDRFRGVALMWREAAEPGSDKWNEVMHALLETGVTLDPTMVIYSTFRDVDRAENMPWLKNYTHPGTLSLFRPSREVHAAFHYHWTTQFESEWKWMFKKWMTFLNEFKNRGGRVTIGTDAGVGLQVYGFSFIRDMELLHEAGFNPLEVVRAATLDGARTIFEPKGQPIEFGVIEPGYLADLVIVKENPLDNFKVLYATGTHHVDEETGEIGRSEGIKYVVKDGIVYDADRLRQDLRAMVADAKRSAEWSTQGNGRQ